MNFSPAEELKMSMAMIDDLIESARVRVESKHSSLQAYDSGFLDALQYVRKFMLSFNDKGTKRYDDPNQESR